MSDNSQISAMGEASKEYLDASHAEESPSPHMAAEVDGTQVPPPGDEAPSFGLLYICSDLKRGGHYRCYG